MKRWQIALLIALLMAAWRCCGALGEDAVSLQVGHMVQAELSDSAIEYEFVPAANGLYALYVFPAGEDALNAQAELLLDGETLLRGDGSGMLFSIRLNAETKYTLRIFGDGAARFEMDRETLSRSFGMPLELEDGEGYSKSFARVGDVHWYSMTAQTSGAALWTCASERANLNLSVSVFSAQGRLLATSETLASGTAALSVALEAGENYRIRVSGDREGKYSLECMRSENATRAQSVQLSSREITLNGIATDRLEATVQPEGACDLIYFDSSAKRVARAWANGYIEGIGAGQASITVYAYGGARSVCTVTVEETPLEQISLSAKSLSLAEDETRTLTATLSPLNTTQQNLKWSSSDESVATVDRNGLVTAVAPGETVVTVASQSGVSASLTVTVKEAPPRYRALLIGEQEYLPSVETVREGSEKSVMGIYGMLNSLSFSDGGYYSVQTLMDASRDEVLAAVREAFADARDADTSLIYITCHGSYEAGMTMFLMADGSVLSAAELERELRLIPGKIVLLVDCCGSGGVVDESGGVQDILDGVTSAFQGTLGGASARGSKYRIIASAHLDQDSYRIGFGDDEMTTVFARALCDAVGWNIDLNTIASLDADADGNDEITLAELESYLSRRVMWYLHQAGDYVQNICVYPQDDPSVLFAREN